MPLSEVPELVSSLGDLGNDFICIDMTNFSPNHKVQAAFVKWIESPKFDVQHAKNWARLCHADHEAAMCEATFWAVLTDHGVEVEPNADLTGAKKAPDFRCTKDGRKFYVEVTCIHNDTATKETGLETSRELDRGAQMYHHLNGVIFNECRNKTPQCAGLDAPCVLAVGTFHSQGSSHAVRKLFMEQLLTGETSIAGKFDPRMGRCVGEPYQVTSFRSSVFTRLTQLDGIEHARHPISAVLVGGFGRDPVRLFGLLHPNPAREFQPNLLHRIPFCRQHIERINSNQPTVSAELIQRADDWKGT